jgi:hypothetical protein
MTTPGFASLVYVDTDSVIFGPPQGFGRGNVPEWLAQYDFHHKGTYDRMTIHGPRNYTTEHERRISGVPLKARQTAPLEFTGEVMRSVKESMRAGQLDCVASIPRVFHMNAPDLRRQHLDGGKTAPFRVQLPQPQEDA